MLFEYALQAHIPIIGVTTDDPVNVECVLHHLTGYKAVELPSATHKFTGKTVYYTYDMEHISVSLYNRLLDSEHQLIVINPDKKSALVFDGGTLPTPDKLVRETLVSLVSPPLVDMVLPEVKGLSLKTLSEVIMLTQARYGSCLPKDIKKTRALLRGLEHGLYAIDTDYDFYQAPEKLENWLKLNNDYFLNPDTPAKLVPRGVLLEGYPGTGKSMGAKAIANHFGIPLYRLDISTVLNKFQGETENRIARILDSLEKEAPAVLLLDEVEKIFAGNSSESTGVITRVLSQLLWWLAEHRSKILTVMTTNNLTHIPPELYRPGRIDLVMKIPRLSISEAHHFGLRVVKSVLGSTATIQQVAILKDALKAKDADEFAHSDIATIVYDLIKSKNWLQPLDKQKAAS